VCQEMDVGRYIYVGTACSFPQELQNSTSSMLREDQKFPANPESAYGWSKLMGELEAKYLTQESSIPSVVLSLHNVYGTPCIYADNTSQVIPALIYRVLTLQPKEALIVWGDGRQGRAFVHVSDVVVALLSALHHGHDVPGAIQIGPDYCTSIKDLSETIREVHGTHFPIEFDLTKPTGDIGRCADYSLASRTLGWKPQISLETGIEDVYNYISEKLDH
ncbi:NAD-dependent epimerase/dehydratase family protein, partial [Planktomarina temperata]|nr:NAD-dependent epimerase/dehydratase family protein [Planktomarina temperata]